VLQESEDRFRQVVAMRGVMEREPSATVVVLGDTNNSEVKGSTPLFGIGREAGALNQFAPTHLTNKCFERMGFREPWRFPLL